MAVAGNFVVIGIDGEPFGNTLAAIEFNRPTGFGTSDFVQALRAETGQSRFLAAVDVEGFWKNRSGFTTPPVAAQRLGIANLSTVLASANFTDQVDNRALRFVFSGPREGVMSWLDVPGPFGATQFFSPDTHFLMSARVKRPQQMLQDLFTWTVQDRPGAAIPQTPEDLKLVEEIAATLGNEVAIGLDNPVLPIPNVKFAFEVIDPIGFHNGVMKLMTELDSHAGDGSQLQVNATDYRGHLVVDFKYPGSSIPVAYAVVDDYVVFGPGRPFLESAIDMGVDGRGIDKEYAFQQALPGKSGSYASALFYFAGGDRLANAAPLLGAFAPSSQLRQPLEEQRASTTASGHAGAYVIAENQRIDLYVEGVKGEFEMGNALPMVADWLGYNTAQK